MMTEKQRARWDALPQEEKDRIDAMADADMQRAKEAQEESKAVELRKAHQLDPEKWRSSNLPNVAALVLVKGAIHDEPTTEATFMANYHGKIRELSRPTDTALERSLVEYAAVCWLRLQCVDMAFTQHSDGAIESLDFWDRHLSAAQRRFDRACLDLVKVRRLALPVVQLNIGDKQVNVGQVSRVGKDTREEGNGRRDEC